MVMPMRAAKVLGLALGAHLVNVLAVVLVVVLRLSVLSHAPRPCRRRD